MATGTTTLNFGSFPGGSDTLVNITGQTAITPSSFVEAWLVPTATADHTADEHLVETIKVLAGNIVNGVGFTIYGINTGQINEPLQEVGSNRNHQSTGTAAANSGYGSNTHNRSVGGLGTRIYGQWTVAWVWV